MAPARIRAASLLPGLEIVDSVEAALRDADVAGLVTEWPEFLGLDWAEVAEWMRIPAVVDGRNALDPDAVLSAGVSYIGFGRQVGRVAVATTRRAAAGSGPTSSNGRPPPPTDLANTRRSTCARC